MAEKWMDIFALSQFSPRFVKLPYSGRTVRIIVRNYLEGDRIRIVLANRYGRKGLPVSRVSVCNSDEQGNFQDQPCLLTFNTEEYGIIAPKSSLISDDMDYKVRKGYLAVSIYFGAKAYTGSVNMLREKVIVSEKGDFTLSKNIENCNRATEKLTSCAFKVAGVQKYDVIPALESISVLSDTDKGTVIAFGDSITQGGKWTYELAERIDAPVLNLGISGNRILRDCSFPIFRGLMGEAALKRFDRDVLTRAGAKAIIVMLGTNDIGQPGSVSASRSQKVTADEVISGLTAIAERARKAGWYTFVCTHTPFRNFRMGYIGDSIEKRHLVNKWISNNKVYDGYFDFDAMIRDNYDPERIADEYDSGDHLHPSDKGSVRMLDAVDTEILRKICEGKL